MRAAVSQSQQPSANPDGFLLIVELAAISANKTRSGILSACSPTECCLTGPMPSSGTWGAGAKGQVGRDAIRPRQVLRAEDRGSGTEAFNGFARRNTVIGRKSGQFLKTLRCCTREPHAN